MLYYRAMPSATHAPAGPGTARTRTAGPPPWVTALLVLLALAGNIGFYLPEIPEIPGQKELSLPHLDKLYHAGVFALTTCLLAGGIAARHPRAVALAPVLTLLHAVVIEAVQAALPRRSADPADALADAVGVGLGMLLWAASRRLSPRGRDGAARSAEPVQSGRQPHSEEDQ